MRSASEACGKRCEYFHRHLRSSSGDAGGGSGAITIAVSARQEATPRKKEAERRQARIPKLRIGAARTLQGALACRRSTTAPTKGSFRPDGPTQASLPETGGAGAARSYPVPVQRSTSHAGRSAGRHDA